MSKAIQCDRCKRCFSPESLPNNEMDFFITFKEFYDQSKECYEKQTVRQKFENLNLCMTCSKDFYAFMNMRK